MPKLCRACIGSAAQARAKTQAKVAFCAHLGWRRCAERLAVEPMSNPASPPRDPEFFDEGQLVGVWTTQPLGRRLDYKAPEGGLGCRPG